MKNFFSFLKSFFFQTKEKRRAEVLGKYNEAHQESKKLFDKVMQDLAQYPPHTWYSPLLSLYKHPKIPYNLVSSEGQIYILCDRFTVHLIPQHEKKLYEYFINSKTEFITQKEETERKQIIKKLLDE